MAEQKPTTNIVIYDPWCEPYRTSTYDKDLNSFVFPLTDSCERSATLLGEDYIRLVFNLDMRVTLDAFAYIEYNGQTFFLKEKYTPKGEGTITENGITRCAYYKYDVKFMSMADMLSKHICYRHVVIDSKTEGHSEWDEPEISISANLETMYTIVMSAIEQASYRLPSTHYTDMLLSICDNGTTGNPLAPIPSHIKLTKDTQLETYSFQGASIKDVLTTIANQITQNQDKDTEWYIEEDEDHTLMLHVCKCEDTKSMLYLSDHMIKNEGSDKEFMPYKSGGLLDCQYANEWSDIMQTVTPFGSDRNMSDIYKIDTDQITQMMVTYGRRLRLDRNHTYKVHPKGDKDTVVYVTTDERGSFSNDLVNTHIEGTKFYDDVYPQCHFQITNVKVKMKKNSSVDYLVPEYTCEAVVCDSKNYADYGRAFTKEELVELGFYPLRIEEGQTLSVRFESGYLNGREFEISNRTTRDEGAPTYSLKFVIIATGSSQEGNLIPSGNFEPKEGDQFALFNMKMPAEFVSLAKNVLAQRAYEDLVELQQTRPDVKCKTDPYYWKGQDIWLGQQMTIRSGLFEEEGVDFISRVTAYSYKLTTPSDIQFTLKSAIMQGTLSSMQTAIAENAMGISGVEQRAINLSRRGWHDAAEAADMLDSITAEMMLVGNEKYQFAFSSEIRIGVDENSVTIGTGELVHTQEPYTTNYGTSGRWYLSQGTLTSQMGGKGHDTKLDENVAYYLYIQLVKDEEILGVTNYFLLPQGEETGDGRDEEDMMLLGILSSQFEGKRVFSRTNGFTAIEGGTITTEQIQDANRDLIIDFQSKRIIARNGATIEGNIKFESAKDKDGNDVLEQLGIAMDDAKKAIEIAEKAAEKKNYYQGGDKQYVCHYTYAPVIISLVKLESGIYNFSVTKDGGFGAADGRFATSCIILLKGDRMDNSYTLYDINDDTLDISDVVGIYDWGTTNVTTNETTTAMLCFANREFVKDLFKHHPVSESDIEFTSDEEGYVWEIKGITVLSDYSDAVQTAIEKADKALGELDDMAADGKLTPQEKLNVNREWAEIVDRYNEYANQAIELGVDKRNYDGSYNSLNGYLQTLISKALMKVTSTITREDFNKYFKDYYDEEIKIVKAISDAFAEGKANAIQLAMQYLTDALKNGSTTIAGGVVLSEILMLKDRVIVNGKVQEIVHAGMSGKTNDNVTLWGGGSYTQAVSDALGTTDDLPVLITKKGEKSKIGCLRVVDGNTVEVNSENGKVVINTESGGIRLQRKVGVNNYEDKVIIVPKTIGNSGYMPADDVETVVIETSGQRSISGFTTIQLGSTFSTAATGKNILKIENGQLIVNLTARSANSSFMIGATCSLVLQRQAGDGSWVDIKTLAEQTERATLTQSNPQGELSYSATFNGVDSSLNYNGTTHRFALKITSLYEMTFVRGTDSSYVKATKVYTAAYTPKTIIGIDGIISAYNNQKYFKVINTTSGQQIIAKGLQGNTEGLDEGSLYKSSNFIDQFKSFLEYFKVWVDDVRSIGNNREKAETMKQWADDVIYKLKDTNLIAAN